MADIAETNSDLDSTARFDRDELVRGWRSYEASVPQVEVVLKFAARTDMGQVRENNEDKFDFYEPEEPGILAERGCLYAVADGMGGALAGQIASELMLKQVISGYFDHPASDPIVAMHDAIVQANDRIYTLAQMIPERSGMGTTLVALMLVEDRVLIAQVGDSRVYRIRNCEIEQITHDHSWVEEQVRAGHLSRSDAQTSPFRNVITRSIGATPSVQPDFYEDRAVVGDVWVLCSDGLTGHVEAEEIGKIAGSQSPSEAARQLIELANSRGGRDNITVFVLSVRQLRHLDASRSDPLGSGSVSAGNDPNNPSMRPVSGLESASSDVTGAGAQQQTGWRKLFGKNVPR